MFSACCRDVSYKGIGGQSKFKGGLAIAAHLKSIVGLLMSGSSGRKAWFMLQCCKSLW